MSAEPIPYRDAITELETILDAIERDDVDLDELAQKVERAAELIQLCSARIEHTELQVKNIIGALDAQAQQKKEEA